MSIYDTMQFIKLMSAPSVWARRLDGRFLLTAGQKVNVFACRIRA
ncbi:hypothetical protein ACVXG8_02715 [Escherichia coli]